MVYKSPICVNKPATASLFSCLARKPRALTPENFKIMLVNDWIDKNAKKSIFPNFFFQILY